MGKNVFVKVRATKDSEELIPVRHPSSFSMPPVVTVYSIYCPSLTPRTQFDEASRG